MPATAGQCVSALGAAVTTTIAASATPTFAVFVTASAPVPFDPANKRSFVRFKDTAPTTSANTTSTVTRGATSVAVRTQ